MQKKGKLEHWQIIAIYLAVYDAIAVNAAYFLALWIRFDCRYSEIPEVYLSSYLKFAPWYTIFSVVIFWLLRLYKSIWRFASYSEFVRVVSATAITGVFHTAVITLAVRRMPISYWNFDPVSVYCRNPVFLSFCSYGTWKKGKRRGEQLLPDHAHWRRGGRSDYLKRNEPRKRN